MLGLSYEVSLLLDTSSSSEDTRRRKLVILQILNIRANVTISSSTRGSTLSQLLIHTSNSEDDKSDVDAVIEGHESIQD